MAAGDDFRLIRNAPYRYHFGLRTTSTGQILSGDAANITASNLSSAGNTLSATGAAAETVAGSGMYHTDLDATMMTRVGAIVMHIVTTTGTATEIIDSLYPEPCLDSGVAQAGSPTTITLRAAGSNATGFFHNAIIELVRGSGAGQFRTITDYTSQVATVERAWVANPANDTVYIIHPQQGFKATAPGTPDVNVSQVDTNATAATNLKNMYKGVVNGTVNDGAATTTIFKGDNSLNVADDFYNDSYLMFTSGALDQQARHITDYTGSTRTITLATALPSSPVNGVEFIILGNSS